MTNEHICHKCSHDNGSGGFASGIVFGAVIGAAAAYILSSPDGKEKAQRLLKESKKALKELEKQAPAAAEKIKEVKESVSEKVTETIENVKDAQEESENFTSRFKKRFFRKKGKSLSSLW